MEHWFAGSVPLVTLAPYGAERPMPAVVIYHGFNGKKTDDLIRLAAPLADAGCLTILPDAALHGERAPQDFHLRLENERDALFLESLEGTVRESHSVLEWAATREDIDPERIGVVGTSMGGAVTLAIVCRKDSAPARAAVALMPAAPGPGSAIRQEAAYAPDEEFCFPTPLLMIHGTADYIAPYPNARHFYDNLAPHYSAAPEKLRFIDMPGEEHRIGPYWVEETLAWLGRFL